MTSYREKVKAMCEKCEDECSKDCPLYTYETEVYKKHMKKVQSSDDEFWKEMRKEKEKELERMRSDYDDPASWASDENQKLWDEAIALAKRTNTPILRETAYEKKLEAEERKREREVERYINEKRAKDKIEAAKMLGYIEEEKK